MKKLAFFLLFNTIAVVSFSQSIDDIHDFVATPNWDVLKGKTMIDKLLSNPKNQSKADAWFYKGLIYAGLGSKDSSRTACADCNMEAFEALKKNQQMDDNQVLLKLWQYSPFIIVYANYFDLGAKDYNNSDYKGAFTNFKNAEMLEEYMQSKDITMTNGNKFPELDTSLVQNIALAAKFAKDSAGAATYYKKITDANLSDQQSLGAYQFLVQYYENTRNDVAFKEILEKGKKLYPGQHDFWTSFELDQLEATGTKEEIFAKYDSLFQKNPSDYVIGYNYSVDMYNYVFANDDKKANVDRYRQPLHETLKKVIAIKSIGEDNLLMAKYLYNSSFDNGDSARKVKGVKPADVQKRKALNDLATAQLDECIPYAQAAADYYAALATLKPLDKANYRSSLSILQNAYEAKKNQAKADEYGAKMKTLM